MTTGRAHDATVIDGLIRDHEAALYGDEGCSSHLKKAAGEAVGVTLAVREKAKPVGDFTKRQLTHNRRFAKVGARVEHAFRVLKCRFGYRKVRFRGIATTGAQVFARLALAKLSLARGRIAPA